MTAKEVIDDGVRRLTAPAKLTLSLQVVGVRDDGLHLIDAEMVALDWGDELEIGPGDSLAMVDDDGTAIEGISTGADNLVNRALELAGRTAAVRVVKRIPAGGGLGGGSADAAAVLRWAGYENRRSAGAMGADIPFCMSGGRARVTGIGEHIEPLDFVPRALTLLTPSFGCNTASVYRAWDELGGPRGSSGNDLEPAALHVEPRLAEWRDRLGDASGLTPRLAGSGSTWFVEGHVPGPDHRLVRTIEGAEY